ncbi:tartrate-resistant acid phosphatase type 5-like [Huso huso]|uniref:Tartrate-resistant acid phosphatase type 5-like n=1 Tax=Huso huso TaxID=61971 RepID=A0ABR0Y8P3_HUSHU
MFGFVARLKTADPKRPGGLRLFQTRPLSFEMVRGGLQLAVLLSALPMMLCFPKPSLDLDHRNRSSIRNPGGLGAGLVPSFKPQMGRVPWGLTVLVRRQLYYSGPTTRGSRRRLSTSSLQTLEEDVPALGTILAASCPRDVIGAAALVSPRSLSSDAGERVLIGGCCRFYRNFPSYFYDLHFHVPGSNATLTVLMLDTVLLCGNSDDFSDERPRGPLSAAGASLQLQWLSEQLEGSRADFLLVAGHYPVWSVAEHGPTHCLLDKLRPLLLKHKVTAYLCGHDHNLQYIQESGVGYVVSGAGNFLEHSLKHKGDIPEDSLKFFYAEHSSLGGFAHVEVTRQEMAVTFITAMGKSLYRTTLPRRSAP